MINRQSSFRFSAFVLLVCISYSQLNSQDYKVGDKSDGSRLKPVHHLNLYDENGHTIDPNDPFGLPFSTKQTCGNDCHNYDIISEGFHFNNHDSSLVSDNPSEPWIYTDPTTLSLVPLSYRNTPGTFSPDQVKLSPMDFLFRFGPYYPGGDISEFDSLEHPKNFFRWMVSGKMEVNCLICHDTDPYYDLAEYAGNIRKHNFKWAAAASSSLTEFKGNASKMPDNYDIYNMTTVQNVDQRTAAPPSLSYNKSKFSSANKVYFNVSKNIPNEKCYFCHSSTIADNNFDSFWKANEDVHLKAGLNCVDCHRNGLNHDMIKGITDYNYEGSSAYTCEGCHTQNSNRNRPGNGNLGAPVPIHAGIPPVHFEKLSCTICHSGNWPAKRSDLVKTSRNHFLGMHGTNKAPDVFPHIAANVFVESNSKYIEPRNVIWPSYWGEMTGDTIVPLPLNFVEETIRPMLSLDSLVNFGVWPSISDSLLISTLDSIQSLEIIKGEAVFVTGGKYFFQDEGNLIINTDLSAKGYSWRTAHPVRPASQSLGVNSCNDCHSLGSAFFNGDIPIESSITSQTGETITVTKFQNYSRLYQSVFSFTFFFRPWLKFLIILSTFVIMIVLAGYIFYGLKSTSAMIFSNNHNDGE